LHARDLFRIWVPRAYGGAETDLVTALRVFETISSADGATGWTLMIGAGAGLFGGFLDPAAAREIFADARSVIAGSGAATGTARPHADGYRVTGRWSFASGAHHATWFTANCVVAAPEAARQGDAGPMVRSIAVPAADVEIHATWSVTGMRGTGSDDISVENVFVPRERTFSVLDAPIAAAPIYRVPFFSVAELSFAAVALGIARHALALFEDLADTKRPMGAAHTLAADPDVRARVGRAEAKVRSARAFVFEQAERAWEAARGDGLGPVDAACVRLAALEAVHGSAEAVDLLHARAGMTPLFASSALGRAWRDLHAVSQNAVVSAGLYVEAGQALLEARRAPGSRPGGA
jgi:alkylation response protein AidB-like acyl-CoA dehydrogenase